MTGFHVDDNTNSNHQVLAQKKKKHHKPRITYLLQEGEMETFMDDYLDKEDKPKAPEISKETEALMQGKSEVSKSSDQDNYVTTTIDLKNINNQQYVGTLMFGSNK